MKTKILFPTICALLLSLKCSAAINLSTIAPGGDALSGSVATELLGKVYMHHRSLLSNAEVTVFDAQTSERFTSNGNITQTILLCSVKHENLPTEYYAVTFKGNEIADGTLLGHYGDAMILQLKIPRDELVYQPSPTINFEFSGDTIKALRTYSFFTTARGGRWFNKDGTICNPFVVSSEGTINQIAPVATAVRTDGDANYLSKDHKQPVRTMTEGEYFPIGMSVLHWEQKPASHTLNTAELNKTASGMMSIVEQYDENAPMTPETQSVMEFAKWSFNLGMRHSSEFLTWIANNPEQEQFSHFLQAVVTENENNELTWFNENVNALKDKKARKWWKKWIKNNL